MRELAPDELAQIAGPRRAPHRNGTSASPARRIDLDPEVVASIEEHRFRPVTRLMWRNSRLQFGSVKRLLQTSRSAPTTPGSAGARERRLGRAGAALGRRRGHGARQRRPLGAPPSGTSAASPTSGHLPRASTRRSCGTSTTSCTRAGGAPRYGWARPCAASDRTEGDIDTLSKRSPISAPGPTSPSARAGSPDEGYWREETRRVEDRLSTPCTRLVTKRFVDRRTSALARRLRQREVLVAEIDDKGAVSVEGHAVGRLEGFRFRMDAASNPTRRAPMRQAAQPGARAAVPPARRPLLQRPRHRDRLHRAGRPHVGRARGGPPRQGPRGAAPRGLAFVDEEAGPRSRRRSSAGSSTSSTAASPPPRSRSWRSAATRR
jgi:ATP-dependent RNA helicase SUPV3L1/SUV3